VVINLKSESVILMRNILITETRIVLRTILSGGMFARFVFSGTYVALCTDYRYEHSTEVTA